MDIVGSIIAVLQLSDKVIGYLNDVKNASKDHTQCVREISNLYRLLLILRDHVETGNVIPPWYTAFQGLGVKDGPLDHYKQALETLSTKMTDGGRLKRAGEALVWKFKKEEVASILARIERLKTLLEIALQMDHYKLSQAIKDDTGCIRTHVATIESGVATIQQGQDHAKHSKVIEWLSPTNYPAQQSDIIGRRQEGTGQWFLDAPEFATWLSKPKGALFCPGMPGAGKTMVAAIAIDHLNSARSSSVGVAYVYCNYKEQEEQNVYSMLAAIIKQLVQAQSLAAEPVERLHQQYAVRGTKPSLEKLFGVLKEVLSKYSVVYIVVDALDECRGSDGTRRQFLVKLQELQTGQDVRLMATSRFIPEIEAEFQSAVKLEVRASDEDVRRFVVGQMYRLPKCIQRDLALQKMVEEKIPEMVDGMFLLARLHVDSLSDKTRTKEVKTALANLSKGSDALDDAYKDALERIKGQLKGHYELAKQVLSWITYAKRPLTTAELCCALAVELDEPELDPENVPEIEDTLSLCAGLVVVDQESDIVRLVHYTTQEYFERMGDTWNPDAQLYIASTCISYLSFDVFKTGGCSSEEDLEDRLQENKLLDYAAKHWGEHVAMAEDKVCGLVCSYLSDERLVSSATQVLLVEKRWSWKSHQKNVQNSTGLHLAARLGLPLVLNAMLPNQREEKAAALEKRDGESNTLLILASKTGHNRTVELLLDKGAYMNTYGEDHRSALQVASHGGYEAIVKLLLDKGADVNMEGRYYGSALQIASIKGYEAIVKLLLNKGANVNPQDRYHSSALQAASREGYEAIVKLLVDKGADVNMQYGYYGSALQVASFKGYEAIVKLLLDKGADVNMQDGYSSALQAASFRGHEAIVKLLLNKGADVNMQGRSYGSALQAASLEGHEAIVKLLLDKGADVNMQGRYHSSALQAASDRGHEAIIKLLLDNGANVNI